MLEDQLRKTGCTLICNPLELVLEDRDVRITADRNRIPVLVHVAHRNDPPMLQAAAEPGHASIIPRLEAKLDPTS
jgi:hypothetical protein